MSVLCTWVKLLTDLQIWAVNCTKMRLAARLCPDPLGKATALRRLPSHYMRKGREGSGRKELRIGKGREGKD